MFIYAPAIASKVSAFLGKEFLLGYIITGSGAAIAVSVTGAQIAAAGAAAAIGLGILFAQLPMNGGPSNGTLSNDSSIGHYDENGNLTERTDISGRPHYIKELGDHYLPHTHHYRWEFIKGAWRIIKKWLTP